MLLTVGTSCVAAMGADASGVFSPYCTNSGSSENKSFLKALDETFASIPSIHPAKR